MADSEVQPKKKGFLKEKSQRVILITILIGILIAAAVFSLLGVNISNNTKNTVDDIGDTYMSRMGNQIKQRFEAVMEQRLTMVRGIINVRDDDDGTHESDNPDNLLSIEKTRQRLIASAEARDFQFLALYRVDEDNLTDSEGGRIINMLIGDDLYATDHIPFRRSVLAGEEKVAVGTAKDDGGIPHENMVIISVPTHGKFTMDDGEKSMSVLAGVTNSTLVSMLNIGTSESTTANEAHGYDYNTSTLLVRRDQTVILMQQREENDPHYGDNAYKNRPLNEWLDYMFGKDLEDTTPEEIVKELAVKMKKGEAYTNIIHAGAEHLHIYCGPIVKTEWYVVVVMNNSELNNLVNNLGNQWTTLIIVAIVMIAVVIAVLFVEYWYFNKQNMHKLEEAHAAAIHASKAKSEFLSNMSHDIRTPMNAIVGMTTIARANINNPDTVADCLKKINISSKHLLGLINDVLDMSKIESGKMTLNLEQISLREVIDGITTIVQPQIKTKRQNFNVTVENVEQEKVYCDGVRLNQVLINLLSNSIKFTADEGTIEFHLDQSKSPLGDNYVRNHIRVKDNGIGMSEEFQKKIFESFSREDNLRVHRTEGTGLGMAITKYIVDAMKGTIEVKSKLGEGTQFDITLDLERVMIPEEEMVLPSWKMLVVDDDEQTCETTLSALGDLGIQAESAFDGESAIEKAVAAHDGGAPYDIMVIDWKLPGIDGVETARRIRKHLGDEVPILLMSAYDSSEVDAPARSAGICGFLNKPLFKSTLYYGLKSISDSVKATGAVPTKKEEVSLEGLHVLLAEDNELNWEIAEVLLDSVGITCDHAENGQICVDMFKNAAPGTYRAILMDIRMPVMNGLEAAMEIRKLDHPDHNLPIIAMTADAFTDDMKRCLDAGMNAHIAKPIDIETVQKTLKKYIKA
ncbi:MAG: response regulator [Clostridiales bacterium]|nr:response regulator [Clostridiales bacterium]